MYQIDIQKHLKYNIYKLSGCNSPWVTSYFPLSFTTAYTSLPEETRKPPLFHNKQPPKSSAAAKIAHVKQLVETKRQAAEEVKSLQ